MDCCSDGPRWTLSTLVAAFLDLAIAYLLLCCATLSFLASHFLSFFGLRLPCPHFHAFLRHSPTHAVQAAALTRFPFGICDLGRRKGGVLEGNSGGAVLLDADRLSPPPPPPTTTTPARLGWRELSRSPSPRNLSVGIPNFGADDECNSDGLLNWEADGSKGMEKIEMQRLDGNEEDTIRVLERALDGEQSARLALYFELEKERNSASIAADEAMAMIERLQKEKATVEMNARQYQRMVEEKNTYDEEEMEILKEIIVRQERELHVLGKEVEMLRQMDHSSLDSDGDPSKILQQISNYGKEKEPMDLQISFAGGSGANTNKNSETFDNMDFQEKGIVSIDVYASDVQCQIAKDNVLDVCKLDKSYEHGFDNRAHFSSDRRDDTHCNKSEVGFQQDGGISHSSQSVSDSRTVDVHVINDQIPLSKDGDGKRKISWIGSDTDLPPDTYGIRTVESMSDHSSTSWTGGDHKIQTQRSDSTSVNSVMASSFDPSCSRISLVDAERTKLENEVEGLKERLRIIQLGRQKLHTSPDQIQKENFQLQLLQEIALQLQEIRRATRGASLPPPSSKCNSRKRRSRSDSRERRGSN